MLAYVLNIDEWNICRNIETENFNNTTDLYVLLLVKFVTIQMKRGLKKDYVVKTDTLHNIKSKIDINESIRQNSLAYKKFVCTYNELTFNTYLNQIIKTTIVLLLKCDISSEQKKFLKRILSYLKDIDIIDYKKINWNIDFNRCNKEYRVIINICYLIVSGQIQSQKEGKLKVFGVLNEELTANLYERFIFAFYKRELPSYICVNSPRIKWYVDDGYNDLLPMMKTDTMLSYKNKICIIDAKYYSKTLQEQYGKKTLHSNNMYQIFAYVKNKQVECMDKEVSGILLYAKTDESIVPNNEYEMSGNTIKALNVDLNCDFVEIKRQLLEVAEEWNGNMHVVM